MRHLQKHSRTEEVVKPCLTNRGRVGAEPALQLPHRACTEQLTHCGWVRLGLIISVSPAEPCPPTCPPQGLHYRGRPNLDAVIDRWDIDTACARLKR